VHQFGKKDNYYIRMHGQQDIEKKIKTLDVCFVTAVDSSLDYLLISL